MPILKVPVGPHDHTQGDPDASISLVEYGDYECPYCGQAYFVVKKLQKHFGDRLLFVFRNFPLQEIHPMAESAAEAAEFADQQGLFWPMHDLIYENQEELSIPLLYQLAKKQKLAEEGLRMALENKKFAQKIQNDFMGGVRSGVNGTPTFFINGQRYNGPHEFQAMIEAIEYTAVG